MSVLAPSPVEIESLLPDTGNGQFAIKREIGDLLEASADVFREGHDAIRVCLQYRRWFEEPWNETEMRHVGNDRWAGSFLLEDIGRHQYRVLAFPDEYESWRHGILKKVDAGVEIASDLVEGRALIANAIEVFGDESSVVKTTLASGLDLDDPSHARLLTGETVREFMRVRNDGRRFAASSPVQEVYVDRLAARYSSWYEIFPRSAGTDPEASGTFDDVIARLDDIQQMGFDVLYFPPIHPIGTVNRKGPNNSLHASPEDPGCPYAIGSALGGHDAIEPSIGTLADFHRLVEAAKQRGIELALDFAISAAPDHPWVESHPEWFFVRPDGSIKYAENPPKKYEDIYPINFTSTAWQSLWEELRRVVLFWIDQGVTIFRVDNPHTKPFAFWEWLIREVQNVHPEAIFLSEAFTRPKVMKALAKAGFSQSYTYFTWRNSKQELIDYFEELTNPPVSEYMRGNLFTNTPDILPYMLQEGGRPAFAMRAVLAATLSSTYGIFSGFELSENDAIPGREEYVNSDKYQIRVRDWNQDGNIKPLITRLNAIRRQHPALQEYDNLTFHWSQNDQILVYSKVLSDPADNILVVVNLDPYNVQESMIYFPPGSLGLSESEPYWAFDLLSDERYRWSGGDQYVRLDPYSKAAHVLHLRQHEHIDFDDPSG